jgi:hydroxymethylbilane synthase
VAALDDPDARLTTTAERALLASVEAGCQVPLGALATLVAEDLHLYVAVCALDGSSMLTVEGAVPALPTNAARLGERLAHELLAKGARRLIAEVRERGSAVAAP